MFDDFYGLTARPFQLTPDPNFYFESNTHRKALSYLGYGLAQGEGFIVITGEVGAGKSTLVAHLMRKIDPSQLTVGQIVTSNLDGEEMVLSAAQAFGIELGGSDKAAALAAIEGFLQDEARAGRRCLLVVDESQNLSVEALEELRMLSNFQLGAHPLLQTLLLGQPEFKQVLAEHDQLEQLRQRVIAAHHLEAMDREEIEPYVTHRLKCVGWTGNPAIDQRVFADLHEATGGIPRRVNQMMSRLLLLGAVEQRTRLDAAMLSSIRKEMQDESTFPMAAPKPLPKIEAAPAPGPVKHAFAPPPAPRKKVEALLAERDERIAELQKAIADLAKSRPAASVGDEDWKRRLAALEARVAEQDEAVRQVLTLLIDWFEGETPRAAA
ncbi:XrtA-associated ATPase [Tsuneonella sp. YG55]|uniref:XrtA-associated ATPase n=1 Tax=Tsuneonella litorea TaxID=2976475 RepID=A0A9X3A7T5_9SPHN|nr:XrtA/PEP-CTERM system-associated ATPase [Tsuneonella litorea]MCT2558751.1 XrtA-associated ATPase [Tsuneonella litorea]